MRWVSSGKLRTAIIASLVVLAAPPALSATSAELAAALGVAPELVLRHNLFTTTGDPNSEVVLSGEESAAAFPDEQAILISNGLAVDGGLGDTDRGNDGSREFTVFSIDLQVPADARTLAFRTRFISREYKDGNNLDKATLTIDVEPCQFGCIGTPNDLVSVADAVDTTNPNLLRIVNVEDIDVLKLIFTITDEGNGALDSAIRISDLHFSEEPSPSPARFNSELPPEDVKVAAGTYRYQKTLFSVPGNGLPFELTLYYNAAQTWSKTFGRKWSHNYEWRLARLQNGGIHIRAGDGGSVYFAPPEPGTPSNVWVIGGTTGAAAASFDSGWSGVSGSVERVGSTYIYTDRSQRRYVFDLDGRLTAMEDSNGNRIEVAYNSAGNVASVTDTRGIEALFGYINDEQLVSVIYETPTDARQFTFIYYAPVINAAGEVQWELFYFDEPGIGRTTFTYDEDGNMLTATDADGRLVVDNRYAGETLIERADGKGLTDTYRYFSDSVEQTDRLGRVSTSVYDGQDRLRAATDTLGNTSRYTYDADGNVTRLTDPLGNAESRSYDARSNLTAVTNALGDTQSYEYDARNNLTRVTDALGYSTDYVYDADNNLRSETDANGNRTTYTHTAAGLVASATDPNGNVTRSIYAPSGDLVEQTDPLESTITYAYDAFGMPVQSIDENGHATTMTYDNAGRLTSVTDALENTTSFTLNARGQTTAHVRADGTTTTYEYDENGRMTRLTDALGNSFLSSFDAVGNLETQTDPLGHTTTMRYDAADRLVGVEDALGGTATAGYDAADRRTSITAPGGGTTRYEYDAVGRVVSETDPVGNEIGNRYDARGLTAEIVNGRGRPVTFEYDPAGRLVSEGYPGFTVRHTLDPNGNLLRTVGRGGATITREFDALDRLVSRTDPNGRTVRYEYDAVGNLTRLIYPDGRAVTYEYDVADRLVEVVDWAGRVTSYTWDSVGNLTMAVLPDGSVLERDYDAVDRLTRHAATTAAGETVIEGSYAYDAAGRRVAADVTYPLDPTTAPTPLAMTYDAADQLASVGGEPVEHDADGNLVRGVVKDAQIDLEYDDRNWLLRAGGDSYRYDEEGNRIGATLRGRSLEYTVDTNAPLPRVLEEFDADGNVIARYVHGLGLISREGAAGEVSVYHYDPRGSTVALTDLEGTVTDRYAYDPWGRVSGRTGRTANPFTYVGLTGVMDDGNGLYFMRARYYAPRLMRFIQRDPVFEGNLSAPQSLNRYAYALGNPIQFTDPDGESVTLTVILVGAALGVGGEIAWDTAFNGFDPLGGWEDAWAPYLEDNWLDLTVAGVLGAVGSSANLLRKVRGIKSLGKKIKRIKKLKPWATGSINAFKRKAWRLRGEVAKALVEGVFTGALTSAIEEGVFWVIETDNWTSLATDAYEAISEDSEEALEQLGEWIEDLPSNTYNRAKKAARRVICKVVCIG